MPLSLKIGLGLPDNLGAASVFAQVQALYNGGAVRGGLFDISNLSTLYADRSATPSTPASVDGVVGTILDLSGNDQHFIAPSDGARATLRSSGGFYYLEFGSGHYYDASSINLGSTSNIFFAFRATAFSTDNIFGSAFSSPKQGVRRDILGEIEMGAISYVGTGFTADQDTDYVGLAEFNTTSSFYRQNGVNGSSIDPGSSVFGKPQLGNTDSSGANFVGRIYGAGYIDNLLSEGEKALVDSWLASLNGVTLS